MEEKFSRMRSTKDNFREAEERVSESDILLIVLKGVTLMRNSNKVI